MMKPLSVKRALIIPPIAPAATISPIIALADSLSTSSPMRASRTSSSPADGLVAVHHYGRRVHHVIEARSQPRNTCRVNPLIEHEMWQQLLQVRAMARLSRAGVSVG